MKDRVVEILMYIMAEIQNDKRIQEIDVGQLSDRGYTQTEISAAFSWLYDNIGAAEHVHRHPGLAAGGSRRVFHEAEKLALSTQAQGYLIQLRELGLLDDGDLEQVIERAMVIGYQKLSLDDIRDIAGAVLLGKDEGGPGRSRSSLTAEDSIH
jgi:uncharacterized protein Smg (DUF494 family)